MQTIGLQLCDANASSSYGAAQCSWLTYGCQGAIGLHCWPYWVWSTLVSSKGKAYDRVLNSGSFTFDANSPHEITFAFSVRCVLDLKLFIQIQMPVCSCATGTRVLYTVLHSVDLFIAAVRAL